MATSHLRLAAALGAVLLSVSACEEDDRSTPCGSLYPGGVIEGRVITGDVRPVVRVTAQELIRRDEFAAWADTLGRFYLELPIGAYVLTARINETEGQAYDLPTAYYRASGPPYTYENWDTLSVSADTAIVADFTLGSMEVTVALPTIASDTDVELEGFRIDEDAGSQNSLAGYRFSLEDDVEDGRISFSIGGLQPGSYRLRLNLSGPVTRPRTAPIVHQTLWLPASLQPAEAETIAVPASGTAHFETGIAVAPAHLSGVIRGSWRQISPEDTPCITLITPDSSATVAYFETLYDGTFEVDIQAPEAARMRIDIGSSQRWYPHGNFAESEILDLAPGASLPPIEVVESGVLLDIRNPLYPPSVYGQVQLIAPAESRVVARTFVYGYDGRFLAAFVNLDPGDYHLRILPYEPFTQAWRPQWYDRAARPQDAALIRVPPDGDVLRVPITLEQGGRIEGRIWFVNPPDTYGVLVYLTEADDPTSLGHHLPGDDG